MENSNFKDEMRRAREASSEKEAFKILKEIAENGYAIAQYKVGKRYLEGIGVIENSKEAAKWFLSAAKQGDREAQYILGSLFSSGNGVPQSVIHAYVWYAITKANGFKKAELSLEEIKGTMSLTEREEAKEIANRCYESDYKDYDFIIE